MPVHRWIPFENRDRLKDIESGDCGDCTVDECRLLNKTSPEGWRGRSPFWSRVLYSSTIYRRYVRLRHFDDVGNQGEHLRDDRHDLLDQLRQQHGLQSCFDPIRVSKPKGRLEVVNVFPRAPSPF